MENCSWELLFWLLSAIAINCFIQRLFWRRLKRQILLSLIPLYCLSQTCWLLLSVTLGGAVLRLLGASYVNLNEAGFRIAMGLTIMPIVAVSIALFFSCFDRDPVKLQVETQLDRRLMNIILGLFAASPFLYYVSSFLKVTLSQSASSIVCNVISYLHLSLFMTPALIGLYWRRYFIPVVVFLIAMLLTAVFAYSEGSRTLIFMPAVFFCVGVWVTLNWRLRSIALVIILVLAIPVFTLSALIETVRREVRDSDAALWERIQGIGQLVFNEEWEGRQAEQLLQGVNRMIMQANIVVVCSTPEIVPYRGFETFLDECWNINRSGISGAKLEDEEERLESDMGLGAARLYGFEIGIGGTVPFPVLADGWSRAGMLGVVLFCGILCCFWGAAEHFARFWFAEKPHFAAAFIAILGSSAYDRMGVYGFNYNLRYLVMQLALWSIVFYFVSRLSRVSISHRRLKAGHIRGIPEVKQ